MIANKKIRDSAKRNNVRLWEVAAQIGVSEATMTRLLRKELPAKKTDQLMEAIAAIAADGDEEEV